jgi:[NiFe] hydrogenase diaphorase moiety large subunit
MSNNLEQTIERICHSYNNDRTLMMNVVSDVQAELKGLSTEAIDLIARHLNTHRVEVESLVSFYSFYSQESTGKVVIRLCNDVIDRLRGVEHIAEAFEDALGIKMGETTPDGAITLEWTPCIGMCDQAPAALINDEVVTNLTSDKVRQIVDELKEDSDPKKLHKELGDGNNSNELVNSMVRNNIRMSGPVVLAPFRSGQALSRALALHPAEVIRNVKTARLRGRGGAGFPTGMKWEFTRSAKGDKRYILCNADEGEPGTFKDRVLLTEYPDLVFEGMTVGGYAVGAECGIVYLRAEYAYMRDFLESVLENRRNLGLLGDNLCGKKDFSFDIRIQMGAGAYICGEETALISSCEGLRGDPKNRPPFPAQKGYMGCPTSVNNVETFCCVARIMEEGPGWFSQLGSEGSAGTKILSIAGDCMRPGIYEIPFGTKLSEVLKLAGASNAIAVQIGGPSGQMVDPGQFERTICYDDLATGGAMTVFGPGTDLLEVVEEYMEFFIDESCGYCTPCRVGNVLLKKGISKIRAGNGQPEDLVYLEDLGDTVKMTSRCGLGQTSPNPVLSTLKNFRSLYESRVNESGDGRQPDFSLSSAVKDASEIAGRKSEHLN